MGFKYKLGDLGCELCVDKGKISCSVKLCPYVMENLSDLFADANFREAVQNAESCNTLHKHTLLYLKKRSIERGYRLTEEENKEPHNYMKPACQSCNYAAHGFICYSSKDDSCLKDWLKELSNGGR